MNVIKISAATGCLLFLISLAGCDKPELAKKPVAAEKKITASQPKPEPQRNIPGPLEEKPQKPVPKSVKPKEREEGVLSVVEKGDKVIVTGSIKSRFEKMDLIKQLKLGLPEKEIVDELEFKPHRMPLGWEGRVAERFLVAFIGNVENAEFYYEKGIVRLEGGIKKKDDFRTLQMAVINTVNGPFSRDIENNLVVGKK